MTKERFLVPAHGPDVNAVQVAVKELTTLKLIVGQGDQGEPMVTILLPDEG